MGDCVLLVTPAFRPKNEAERQDCSHAKRDVSVGRFKESSLGKGSSFVLPSVRNQQRKGFHCRHFLTKPLSSLIFDGGEKRLIISFSAFTVE